MTKIAVSQHHIEMLADWKSYANKMTALADTTKKNGAELLLLPEYAGIEMMGHHPTDEDLYHHMQPFLAEYQKLFATLAKEYQLYIQPGTVLSQMENQCYRNRAYFFTPDGNVGFQDKLHLIEYEKQTNILEPGTQQTVFETSFGKVGIAVCYDSEFPEVVRALTYAGAKLILVPSYTITPAGLNRVYLSCRARAIENQCYVAVSFVVGDVTLGPETDHTVGQAVVLTPIDTGFPDDGILARGNLNQPEIIYADLDFAKIDTVRKHGQVHNFMDAQ